MANDSCGGSNPSSSAKIQEGVMKKYVCLVFIVFSGCLPKVTLPEIKEKSLMENIENCNHEIAPLRFGD